MKKFISGLAILLLALSFTSCEKDVIADIGHGPAESQAPRIKKTIDSLHSDGSLEYESEYFYTSGGKLSELFHETNPEDPSLGYSYHIKYNYFGNDIQVKSSDVSYGSYGTSESTDDVYYYCSQNGICDSLVGETLSEINQSSYSSSSQRFFGSRYFRNYGTKGPFEVSRDLLLVNGDTSWNVKNDTTYLSEIIESNIDGDPNVYSDVVIPDYYKNISFKSPKLLYSPPTDNNTFFLERQYRVNQNIDTSTHEVSFHVDYDKWVDYSYKFDEEGKLVKIIRTPNEGLGSTQIITYYENQF